jgi:ComF family protein
MILEKMDRPDALIPVPMHKRRLRKRGLDHALLLARALGRRAGLPVWEGRLRRVKNTPQQAKSSASSRHTALAGAFLASGVGNSRILLVDDVMTTGSTALACAQTLLKAGAQSVQLITLAGAPIKGLL